MSLRWRTRRRLALLVLVVGLPIYILLALILVVALGDIPPLLQVLIYVVLGVVWVFPLKPLFRGIGQPEPEEERRN